MGQNLHIAFPGPGGSIIERAARIVHLSPDVNDLEVMGLAFPAATDVKRPATRKF